MNPHPHLSVVISLIALPALWLIALPALWLSVRQLLPEDGLRAKTVKSIRFSRLFIMHVGLILAGLANVIGLPAAWPAGTAVMLGSALQIALLQRKSKYLRGEIKSLHRDDSILMMALGTSEYRGQETQLTLWFKHGSQEWPLAELECGTDIHAIPVSDIPGNLFQELFVTRISSILKTSKFDPVFLEIKKDLTASGVTHPIDIKGWDHHPVIREMIERIMNAQSQDVTLPLPGRKAA